ncbi:hypothetical protein FGG08_000998 [Glutinoglossum americanum]|uniref:Uncharacterized protein n=1 Tax=Glutinoglossum americanum TaxID=1670608 RepID=A0A9P8L0Q6_9PEZI|nr:hypothetical protein FGG08_000998 [Glutinoglossum americanum]
MDTSDPVTTGTGLAHFDRPATRRNITNTNTRVGFALKTPLTDRQPLFTAINAFFEAQRNHWFDLFKLPVYVSVSGSKEPVSLWQLDNPVSAAEVPAMNLLEGSVTAYPTVWGATRTTTITTTITAVPGDVVFLQFPTQTPPPDLQYTTVSSVPGDPNSKLYPNGLPILVLTQLNGIVVNPQNQTLTVVSTVQAAPQRFSSDTDSGKVDYALPDSNWSSWSLAEKGGVIAATILAGLLLIAVCAYMCITGRSRKKVKDTEKGEKDGGKQRVRFRFSGKRMIGKVMDRKGKAATVLGKLQKGTSPMEDKSNSGASGGATLGNTSLHSTQRSQRVEQPHQAMSGAVAGPSNT